MIRKLISGGQTGADRAALDVAMELGIPHGVWVPKGRRTEAGPLSEKYHLREMPTASYPARTEKNVIDSDGTLILSHGRLEGGPELTRSLAEKYKRPCLHINLKEINAFQAAINIQTWLKEERIEVLNVAGPRASRDPDIYEATARILKAVFSLDLVITEMPDPSRAVPYLPRTVEQAVDRLISELSLKDKTAVANMAEEDLDFLLPTLGDYVWNKYGLGTENTDLVQSCRILSGRVDFKEDDCPMFVIHELWKKLRETYRLRVVK